MSQSTTTQTTNKHHHHGDGAARPSSSMDFDESMPLEGQAALRMFILRPLLKDFGRINKLM
jgi:hypothetical protein